MFNVFTIVPTYCDRDGINGWSAHVHPYTFVTAAGAVAIARRLGEDAEPAYTVVVPVGASPFDNRAQLPWGWVATDKRYDDAMDDIPF